MRRAFLALALLGCDAKAPAPKTSEAPVAEKQTAAKPAVTRSTTKTPKRANQRMRAQTPLATRLKPGMVRALPPADRVFTATVDGVAHLFGANHDRLWAMQPDGQGGGKLLWDIGGPGVVQRLVVGDLGEGAQLFMARGTGRGFLKAPLVLSTVNLKTGRVKVLWRNNGARNEAAHLSVVDVDGDKKPELAFAYYSSKYMVKAHHMRADGTWLKGAEVRMATTRIYGDVDGDGQPDEVVGRVYGDARGEPGDLKVNLGKGSATVPSDKGVKALLFAKAGADTAPSLYFADGWVANYGKQAKAQLKRLRYVDGKPQIEMIGGSADEFTFFELTTADLDGDGQMELIGQGNKHVTAFSFGKVWSARTLVDIPAVLNTAIGKTGKGWTVYIPGRPHVQAKVVR